jgi:hypothetical protein
MSGTPSWSASAVASRWIRRYAALRLNNTKDASTPAITDPTSPPILTSSPAGVPCPNASSPINNETVKPMPASRDTPSTSRHARSSSRAAWVIEARGRRPQLVFEQFGGGVATPAQAAIGRAALHLPVHASPRRVGPHQRGACGGQQQHAADGLFAEDLGKPLCLRPRGTREQSKRCGHCRKPNDLGRYSNPVAGTDPLRHLYVWGAGKSGRQSHLR